MPSWVSNDSVTKSQPSICVSYISPVYDKEWNVIGNVELSVFRSYSWLPNEWGGKGRHKSLDGDGKIFNSMEEARQYAFDHGYVRNYLPKYNPAEKARKRKFFWEYMAPKKGLICPVE